VWCLAADDNSWGMAIRCCCWITAARGEEEEEGGEEAATAHVQEDV